MICSSVFSPCLRFEITYSHTDRLETLEPFIKEISSGLASGKDFSEQIQASADRHPDAARYFLIDPATADESFCLRDEYTYEDWRLSAMIIRSPNRCYTINLKGKPISVLSRLHTFMALMSTDAHSGNVALDESQERLLQTLLTNNLLESNLVRPLRFASARRPAIYRLQHASLLYRSETTGILVDPHLQSTYSPIKGDDITRKDLDGKVDAILISHSHFDHLWLSTLMMFDRKIPIIVPKVPASTMICMDMKQKLKDIGFSNVISADWFTGPIRFGDMEVWILPFYGEQPLRYEPARNARIRNWGNTYIIKCAGYTSWFLIDSGMDYLGSMVDVADYVRETHGSIDCVLSNLREFCLCSPTYINGGLNWLALSPLQMKRFDRMKADCITLGARNVAEICKKVSARYYLPYAHWWGELGARANSSLDTPGQDEVQLVQQLARSLLDTGCATRIVDWKIGDGFDASSESGVISLLSS